MRLLSLKLRGAVGIYKGMALDEVTLNFEQFDNGLIALVARNGKGKSTILDNLHPFRTLPSRDGFVEHFRLKDSYRILTVLHNNKQYEFKILVDAITRKSEAYAFCDGVALNDGKLTTYDAVIHELFGSEQLFFASVFSAQKSSGISKMTAGERKRLFFELLGLDKYEGYEKYAKASAAEAEKSLLKLEAEMKTLNPEINVDDAKKNIEHLRGNIEDAEREITELRAQEAEIKVKLIANENELQQLQDVIKSNNKINNELVHIDREIESTEESYQNIIRETYSREVKINQAISEAQGLSSGIDGIKSDCEQFDKAKEIKEQTSRELLIVSEKATKVNDKYNQGLKALKVLTEKYNDVRLKATEQEQLYKQIQDKIDRLEKSKTLLASVPCGDQFPSCKFIASAHADIAHEKDIALTSKVAYRLASQLNDEKETLRTDIDAKNKLLEIEKSESLAKLDKKYAELKSKIDKADKVIYNFRDAKSLLAKAEKAAQEITLFEEKLKSIETEKNAAKATLQTAFDSLSARKQELSSQIKPTDEVKLRRMKSELDAEQYKIQRLIKAKEAYIKSESSDLTKLSLQVDAEQSKAQKLLELKPVHEALGKSLCEWQFLAKSFGKAGIPIMKLEHSAALVTVTANDLLALFDSKFRIKIETMTLKSDGKSFKETFNIIVIDEEGEPTDLFNKSGGEQVWVESAIQMAIALVVRKQGKPIKVEFMDEKDGALDPENALNYIRMVQESARISGVEQSFIITHRPELLDLVPQQIHLTNDNTIEYLG